MVLDDRKVPDDGRLVPKLNGVVGSVIPGCEIVLLPHRNSSHRLQKAICVSRKVQ